MSTSPPPATPEGAGIPGPGPSEQGGIPDSGLPGPFPVGEYARRAALQAALARAGAARGRAREPASLPCARVLRAARRRRRDPLRGLARGLGGDPRPLRRLLPPRACRWWLRAAATTTRAAPPPRRASPSPSATCASPAREICWPASTACASSSTPRDCSSLRSGWSARCYPARSASSPQRAARPRDDIRAALARRGWAGRLVWGFAPVQDRHAAPAIVRALSDLAGVARVQVVIVARGGGSLSRPAVLLR